MGNDKAALNGDLTVSARIKHLLVVRFSALGDVAMTVPVVDSLARQHPNLRITVVSRPFCAPLFAALPANVAFFGADVKGEYKGIGGLWKLSHRLKAMGIDAMADLHDVLRTKVVRTFLRLQGIAVAVIDKGRSEKKRLVKGEHKPLRHGAERYADVFRALGLSCTVDYQPRHKAPEAERPCRIGLAPFAAHQGKIYPTEQTTEFLRTLYKAHPEAEVYVFCSKGEAESVEAVWTKEFPHLVFACRQYKGLSQELQLMQQLDVMVSMDSANMHLASIVGLPVVSVWGATHPYAGFLGYGQSEAHAVQLALPCRPCSIYGNKPCRYGDYRCLAGISPKNILKQIDHLLQA